jgi:hypothetical protein
MTDEEMIEILRGRIEQLMETQELLLAQRNAAWERDTYSFNAWKTTEGKLAKAIELLTEPVETHSDTKWLAARNEFLDKL